METDMQQIDIDAANTGGELGTALIGVFVGDDSSTFCEMTVTADGSTVTVLLDHRSLAQLVFALGRRGTEL
jgi:hypothetical protein